MRLIRDSLGNNSTRDSDKCRNQITKVPTRSRVEPISHLVPGIEEGPREMAIAIIEGAMSLYTRRFAVSWKEVFVNLYWFDRPVSPAQVNFSWFRPLLSPESGAGWE